MDIPKSVDTAETGSPDLDRAALVVFYGATDGPNWTKNTDWLTNKPLNTWHGVAVDHGGRESGWTAGEQSTGENTRGVGRPRPLEVLNLLTIGSVANTVGIGRSNQPDAAVALRESLVGDIPSELGNLDHLERMWLTGNRLGGQFLRNLAVSQT